MISRYEYGDGVWIDLEDPSSSEIHRVAREFFVSERFETELSFPTPTPLVANDAEMTFLALPFPAPETGDGERVSQEIDFIIGSDFVITAHRETIAPILHLQRLLDAEQLGSAANMLTTDALLEIIFSHLYTALRDQVDHLNGLLARAEREMLAGRERATVRSLSDLGRAFLHLGAALANQEEPLSRFVKMLGARGYFDPSWGERAERIRAERAHVARFVTAHQAVVTELRETNSALLEARQNEIMKTLAILTVIAEILVVTLSALLVLYK